MKKQLLIILMILVTTMLYGAGNQETSIGVTDETITIGTTLGMSGRSAVFGLSAKKGMDIYIEYINRQGGVNGRKLELIAMDDAFNPSNTASAIRRLVERDRVFAIVGSAGQFSVSAITNYLNNNEIPLVFPLSTGVHNQPPLEWIFPYQPHIGIEAPIMAQELLDRGKERVGIIFPNTDNGQTAYSKAKGQLGQYLVEAVRVDADIHDFSSAILRLKNAGVDSVMIYILTPQIESFVKQTSEFGLEVTFFTTMTNVNHRTIERLGSLAEGLLGITYVPADFSEPEGNIRHIYTKITGDKEQPNGFVVIGMMAMDLFVLALENIEGEITRKSLKTSLENLQDKQGLMVENIGFSEFDKKNPNTRTGVSSMNILQVNQGEWTNYE